MAVLDHDRHLLTAQPGLLLIADKGYASAELDDYLHARGVELLRPAYRNRAARPGQQLLAPIRQLIESVNDTPRVSSTWSCTAAAAWPASPPASRSACSP
jgi:hypothetical protein